MIDLRHLQTYHGPSIVSDDPVVVAGCRIDSRHIDHLRENLRLIARVLELPDGDLPAEGGATGERTDEVRMAATLLDLAHHLLNRRRGRIKPGRVSRAQADGHGELILSIGYHQPRVSMTALRLAADLLINVRRHGRREIALRIERFLMLCHRFHPDYQASLLMDFAESRDIPAQPFVPESKYWHFGWGARSQPFYENMSNADGAIAFLLARDKTTSKAVFRAFGAPTPPSITIDTREQLAQAAAEIGFPCVVKPIDQGGGRGVAADIRNEAELIAAFDTARKLTTRPVMIERHLAGDDHRLMVVGGQLIHAIRRRASSVIGDGQRSVQQLIAALNLDRAKENPSQNPRRTVPIDDVLIRQIGPQGYDLSSCPPAGATIALRSNSNLSTGGIADDVTERIHPALRAMTEQLARSIGLGTGGFDYMTTDISLPPAGTDGGFVEMNTAPGLDICRSAGLSVDAVLEPALAGLGRIPAALVVSDTPALPDIETAVPEGTALVIGDRLRVGACIYHAPRADGWRAVHAALRNRAVTALRIHCTPADIMANGLPLDRFDAISVDSPGLPPEWQRLIERLAGRAHFAKSAR